MSEDSFYGALDVRTGEAYLFMPRLPDSFGVWFGELPTPETVKAKYAVQVTRTYLPVIISLHRRPSAFELLSLA